MGNSADGEETSASQITDSYSLYIKCESHVKKNDCLSALGLSDFNFGLAVVFTFGWCMMVVEKTSERGGGGLVA